MGERSLHDLGTQETEESSDTERKELFLKKVSEANTACQTGNYIQAAKLYTDAIEFNSCSHVLYSNRSAAYLRTGQYSLALEDARKSALLCSEWPKAYYRQGVALQCMGRHSEALAAFAVALAQDKKSPQLLQAITEAAINSPYRGTLEPLILQLKKMELDMDPFVIIAIVGQELLSVGEVTSSICVLESALTVGTDNQKLHGSILSALSSAYWKVGETEKAISFMQQDLEQVSQLKDEEGLCRAHGNLGHAYYSLGRHEEALAHHKQQLETGLKLKDQRFASEALTSLGHVYMSITDHSNALASHKKCAMFRQQMNDKIGEARELGNVGSVYTAMGDYENAVLCHQEHLKMSQDLGEKAEMNRAYSNLGSLYHNMRDFDKAIEHYCQALKISEELKDTSAQCRSLAGLGHGYRAKRDLDEAVKCHAKQLKLAIDLGDRAMEGRARSNMGVALQEKGDFQEALEFHKDHLQLCGELDDKEGEGRACGNIGNAYHSLGQFERAIKYQKLGLALAKELRDKQSEATMHGNLAVAFQALGDEDSALEHYLSHLDMARLLSDLNGECLAEGNLGNFFSVKGDFSSAISHFENQYSTAEKLNDKGQLFKSSQNLAFALYSIGKYDESVEHYERVIELAEHNGDKNSLVTAYSNLGLAYFALKDFQSAYSCQERHLELLRENTLPKTTQGLVRALSNFGESCLHLGEFDKALKCFREQIALLKDSKPDIDLANAHGGAGKANRGLHFLNEALQHFLQETELRRNLQDLRGLTESLSNLGSVLYDQGDLMDSKRYYSEQLEVADRINDPNERAKALTNISTCCFSAGDYDECIKVLSSRLQLLEKIGTLDCRLSSSHEMLGKCYFIKRNYVKAISHYEAQLKHSAGENKAHDENSAFQGLGNSHLELGNYSEALVCFEKCLVLAQDTGITALPLVYSRLGSVHLLLKNYEQAMSYFEKEILEAKAQCNLAVASQGYGELGEVYMTTEDYRSAYKCYEDQLRLSESLQDTVLQAAACNGMGNAFLQQGRQKQAVKLFEKALDLASKGRDHDTKFMALTGLGKANFLLKRGTKACEMFKKAIDIADVTKNVLQRIPSYFRLGVAFYAQGRYALAIENFEEVFTISSAETKCTEAAWKKMRIFVEVAQEMMQKALVMIKQEFKALLVAEKMEDMSQKAKHLRPSILSRSTDKEMEALKSSMKEIVIYYSVAVGCLLIWLLVPGGFVKKFVQVPILDKFEEANLMTIDVDEIAMVCHDKTQAFLEECIAQVRAGLGVEKHEVGSEVPQKESLGSDMVDLVVEAAANSKKNSRIGLPAKLQHPVLSSTPKAIFNFSLRPRRKSAGPERTESYWDSSLTEAAPLKSLYKLLIEPVEKELADYALNQEQTAEVCFVVPRELLLIPFSLLVGSEENIFLRDRYVTRMSTSLKFLLKENNKSVGIQNENQYCIVGSRGRSPCSETQVVSGIFECEPLFGDDLTKEDLVNQIKLSKVCHFATEVLWGSESIMLGELDVERSSDSSPTSDPDIESLDSEGRVASPPLPGVVISSTDIRQGTELKPQLIVFGLSRTSWGDNISSTSLYSLVDACLSTGTQTVITSLWSIDSAPLKIFLTSFYKAYLNGEPSSIAFDYAISTVKREQAFSHPSFWGGLTLFGQKSTLEKKKGTLTHVLHLLLEKPSRDAIKVLLHLVEKSRQRIAQCRRSNMYTAESSIRSKVGDILGWRELLTLVGFRFEKATNGLPDSVFFPSAEHADVLNRCSNTLYAFLGLSRSGLDALSKLRCAREVALPLMGLLHEVIQGFSNDVSYSQVSLNIKIWRTLGCHEFLSSLGFDLMGVGREDVLLRSGKSSLRRPLQCALQAVMDLFEMVDSPIDFMSNVSGKAYSETHIGESPGQANTGSGSVQPSNGGNGFHPMRKARSTPIKNEKRNGGSYVTSNGAKRKISTENHVASNSSYYLGATVGLFGGMDAGIGDSKTSKEDVGASARRLRMRGVGVSRSTLDASPEVLLCKDDREGSMKSLTDSRTEKVRAGFPWSPASTPLSSGRATPTVQRTALVSHGADSGVDTDARPADATADHEVESYFNKRDVDASRPTLPAWRSSEQSLATSKTHFKQANDAKLALSASTSDLHRGKRASGVQSGQGGFWSRCKDIDSVLDGNETSLRLSNDIEMAEMKSSSFLKEERKVSRNIDDRECEKETRGGSIPYLYKDELKIAGQRAEPKEIIEPHSALLYKSAWTASRTTVDEAISGTLETSFKNGVSLNTPLGAKGIESNSGCDLSLLKLEGKIPDPKKERKVVKVSYGYVPAVQSLQTVTSVAKPSLDNSESNTTISRTPVRKHPKTLLELRADQLLQSGDIQASLC